MPTHRNTPKLFHLVIFIGAISYCITSILLVHLELERQEQEVNDQQQQQLYSNNGSNNIMIRGNINHNDGTTNNNNHNHNNNNTNAINDKQNIISILEKSGLEVTQSIIDSLPTEKEVQSLYGSKPVIIGLETCSKFQSTIPESDAYIGGSGMFNTGTNLLADMLLKYCVMPKRVVSEEQMNIFGDQKRFKSGMLWHVPWGKHNPISWRTHHKATIGGKGVEQTHVLPVVTIKDPFHWMASMCRHPYAARWSPHKRNDPICPRLLSKDGKTSKVTVSYRSDNKGYYDSLVGLWNDWYGDYLAAGDEFPRLIIRYEDLLFHFEEVMTQVCECGGGKLIHHENGFVLNDENAKAGHRNGSNGLLGAMLRYGFDAKRTETFTKEDVAYANDSLRKDLMEMFSYSFPKV